MKNKKIRHIALICAITLLGLGILGTATIFGINGYVVPVEDAAALAEKIKAVLASDLEAMGKAALEKVRPYTLENMAKTHAEIFESGR